jgi:hypothetical protein
MKEKELLRALTGKENIYFTERGNKSILYALRNAKSAGKAKLFIPDQGGWLTYEKYGKAVGFEVTVLKTDLGLLKMKDLTKLLDADSCLLYNSMAGYFAMQDVDEITKLAKERESLVINDASAVLTTDYAKEGDIIIGSFGKWKPVNCGGGGFIASDSRLIVEEVPPPVNLIEKLAELPERLKFLEKKVKEIKDDLKEYDIIHRERQGLIVVVKFNTEDEFNRIVSYCKSKGYEYTICPRAIRVICKAVSIEIKRMED